MTNPTNMTDQSGRLKVVAEFDGWKQSEYWNPIQKTYIADVPKYSSDWNELHRVWEKFRELKFSREAKSGVRWHVSHKLKIGDQILQGTPESTFNALYEAITWYNQIKKWKTEEEILQQYIDFDSEIDVRKLRPQIIAAMKAHASQLPATGRVGDEIKKYLSHLPTCNLVRYDNLTQKITEGKIGNSFYEQEIKKLGSPSPKCTCGLDALREKIAKG